MFKAISDHPDVRSGSRKQKIALEDAAEIGHEEMLLYVLNNAKQSNVHHGQTEDPSILGDALAIAARKGYISIIQHLLRVGAEAEARYTCLPVALHSAIVNGHNDAVKLLLNASAKVDVDTSSLKDALQVSPKLWGSHNFEILDLLLAKGSNPNLHFGGTAGSVILLDWIGVDLTPKSTPYSK